jgi:RHS repeat-associated protein
MNLLCSYRYDPLDRLVACTPSAQASTQRFYLQDRLATEIQGTVQHSIMQHDDQLLAQQQRQGSAAVETSLLATDQQRSVLTLLDAKRPHAFAYMPYGYCFAGSGLLSLLSLLGFNGERVDPVTGRYLLGNGYRAFSPELMCFTSPDSLSPFGDGEVNAYAYCLRNPVSLCDPTGHFTIGNPFKGLFNFLKLRTPSASKGISRPVKTSAFKGPLAKHHAAPLDPLNTGPSRFQRRANPQHRPAHEVMSRNIAIPRIPNRQSKKWIEPVNNQPGWAPKKLPNIETQNPSAHTEIRLTSEELTKLIRLSSDLRRFRFINGKGKPTQGPHNAIKTLIENERARLERLNI